MERMSEEKKTASFNELNKRDRRLLVLANSLNEEAYNQVIDFIKFQLSEGKRRLS